MQRSANLRCIVSSCVVYAKIKERPYGPLFYFAPWWDSNSSIQHAGGVLVAAGLDGGDTSIIFRSRERKCKRVPPPAPKKDGYFDGVTVLIVFASK